MRVLVTGANGFVGSHAVRALLRRGHAVTALVRPAADARFLDAKRVTIVRAPLDGSAPLAPLFAGHDAVVHVAALTSDWGAKIDFFRANAQVADAVARAVPAGCHLVLISTNAVLGEEDCADAKREDAPYRPLLPYALEPVFASAMNHYRVTKAIGEVCVRATAARRGVPLTVLRPVWVYGPREFHAGPYEYCKTLLDGVPALPGSRANRFHVIYAEDLARAIALLVERPPERERVLLAGCPEAPRMEEHWGAFRRALGVKDPWLLPRLLLALPALLLEALYTLFGAKGPPLFTRARLEMFYASNVYDTSALRAALPDLTFTPPARAAAKTVRWWRMFGFLGGAELKPEFLTGISKWLFYLKLSVHVVLRYARQWLSGRLSLAAYLKVLWRSTLLLKVMIHNKVVKLGDTYKLQLYLPSYPTPAFWESMEKFIRPDPGPLTVVFSMTKACGYKCPHCYQRNDTGKDLEIEKLKAVARDMQDIGVTMFDIEGGEPLLKYARLLDLLSAFDGKRELWINTTGYSLTPERARELKAAGVYGAMISLHTPDPADYEKFTGVPGSFETAREAARMFNEAGITVALNSCPTSELVDRGGVERIMEIAHAWSCSFVQVIHGKSAGAWLGKQEEMINAKAKIALLEKLHLQYNSAGAFAAWPAASVQVFEESPDHFGCTAGGIDRFYINANGEVQPCEFLNVSFGNVHEEPFKEIFARMRAAFRTPGVHWLCATEAHSIHETLKANNIPTTPVPWKHTQELIKKWNIGPATRMYARMDMYE